jgi:ribonuclease HI
MHLIDKTLTCSEERKTLLKKLLKNNENLKQVDIYTDGSLREDQSRTKRLGYAFIQVGTNQEVICKVKGRTDNWASSTRAELMAILEALLISPENCEANIYTDSAASIQALDKTKSLKARDWLKRNNTSILKALKQIIETKNIRIKMHKVKAHNGVQGNELADSEAKKGIEEDKVVKVQTTQTKATAFSITWREIEIESPIRRFIKRLNNSIVKAEWVFIRGGNDSLHENRKDRMCWKSFKRLVNRHRKLRGNSLEGNSRWIFMLKCINRLLPILEKRYLFRPDLYEDSLCPRCKISEETFEHLLECTADKENWTKVKKEVVEKLRKNSVLKDLPNEQEEKTISILFPREPKKLKLWRQETARGFIPKNLVKEIAAVGISKKKTKTIIESYIEDWLQGFQEEIWRDRYKEITR